MNTNDLGKRNATKYDNTAFIGKRIAGLMVLYFMLLLLLAGCGRHEKEPITSLDQLDQPAIKIAVALDSPQESSLAQDYPKAELIPYADMFLSYKDVASGKIDACVHARKEMELAIQNGTKGVRLLEENYASDIIAVGISPVSGIPDLREKLNAFIAEKKADGTLDDMYNRWVVLEEDTMPELPEPENPSFTLCVGTTGTVMPYSYYKGAALAGYDIELAHRFAAWLGAGLEFKVYDFGGIVAAAQAGSIDCIMSNLFYTPEKDESIPFSDPLFEVEITAMVRDTAQSTQNKTTTAYASVDLLNGKSIGSATGTTYDEIVRRQLPDVTFSYYNTYSDMVAAMQSGKIAAFACDEPVLRTIMAENSQVTMMPEYLDTFEFGFIFPKSGKGSALCEQMSEFIREMRESGELSRLEDKWVAGHPDDADMPDAEDLDGQNGTLTLAINALNAPFDFMRGNAYAGYEVELVVRFCERYGYGLAVQNMDFDAVLASVQTGKADFGSATISITEERKQSVLFSEPHYSGGTVLAVLKSRDDDPIADSATVASFNGKRAGIITGSIHDAVIAEVLPDSSISEYNNLTDLITALKSGKIDYFLVSTEAVASLTEENDDLMVLEEPVQTLDIGAMFAKTEKGDVLRAQMDAFIEKMKSDGTLDEIYAFWSDTANDTAFVDLSELDGENGELKLATSGTKVPTSFISNGKIAGADPDIAARYCREYGYGMDVSTLDIAGIIPGIVSGKYDFSLSDFVITEERKQNVNFSIPYRKTELFLVTRNDMAEKLNEQMSTTESGMSIWDGIVSSFNKTFIRENRWQLFVKGVVTTLVITLLSILFGTLLGFGIFMLCRNGNPVANLVTRFCMWLIQGMPMVVLLMILYYVIFGSMAINGIIVAVVGFTLTFGASVFGLLKMGVGAVDGGQYEAAYALGYSNRRTFFRIILPQALPHVLPAYRGEIVGLIKATAIVGYIAVQDLTKMGDIVRSRTYEAFFPLIAVTVIYFLLEGLIGFMVSRITININPRRRKREDILKGVKTDD